MANHFSFFSRVSALVRRRIGIAPNVPPLAAGPKRKPVLRGLATSGCYATALSRFSAWLCHLLCPKSEKRVLVGADGSLNPDLLSDGTYWYACGMPAGRKVRSAEGNAVEPLFS